MILGQLNKLEVLYLVINPINEIGNLDDTIVVLMDNIRIIWADNDDDIF